MSDVTQHPMLKDRVVVVTGAGSGFGRLICQKAAARGARVVGADIDAASLAATEALVRDAGGTMRSQVTDVRALDQVRALVSSAVDGFGAVDVMVNNAGVMPLAFLADHAEAAEAWDRCIDINFKGVLHGITAVHDQMIAQGRGHVVNLSSIYSNFPVAGAAVYGATKAAVNFLSEALRVESQGRIKVTNVKPTGVPTTGLSSGVVNPEAVVGILGQHAPAYLQQMQAFAAGELPAEVTDPHEIAYYSLDPEHLADQIIYAIDQPWGVVISDVTVRASGEGYIL